MLNNCTSKSNINISLCLYANMHVFISSTSHHWLWCETTVVWLWNCSRWERHYREVTTQETLLLPTWNTSDVIPMLKYIFYEMCSKGEVVLTLLCFKGELTVWKTWTLICFSLNEWWCFRFFAIAPAEGGSPRFLNFYP